MRRQKIDPAVLAEIKDESAWEEAKELFIAEGMEKGALAQQRRTVLQARQMGMDAAAIAALVGLAEEDVEKILRTDQAV
jgi:hypothetical protein